MQTRRPAGSECDGRDDARVGTTIVLKRRSGASDGLRDDLPLDRDIESPVVVDAATLDSCHPMFALRLRLFTDWHRSAGHEVIIKPPRSPQIVQHLANLGVASGLPCAVLSLPEPNPAGCLPVRRLGVASDVDDMALQAEELVQHGAAPFGAWSNAVFMAIGELCGNALEHGRNELGTYVAASPVGEDGKAITFSIADLGMGIPEHIRGRYPECYDDTAAIAQALAEGVSGTGRPDRGNGFTEVFAEALQTDLVRHGSAADLDVRSSAGRVGVELVGGVKKADPRSVGKPRRGTWINYTITRA